MFFSFCFYIMANTSCMSLQPLSISRNVVCSFGAVSFYISIILYKPLKKNSYIFNNVFGSELLTD